MTLLYRRIQDCIFIDCRAKYDNLENSVIEIKSSLYDLAHVLKNTADDENNRDSYEFSRNIQNRELLLENRYLKEKVESLENQLEEKNLRIRMLEKLVLETHL